MIREWRRIGKNLVGSGRGLTLRYYTGMRMEGLRKTTKDLNQYSRSPGPRIEPGTSLIRSSSVNHSIATFGTSLCPPDGERLQTLQQQNLFYCIRILLDSQVVSSQTTAENVWLKMPKILRSLHFGYRLRLCCTTLRSLLPVPSLVSRSFK
jgi:hypothetical protein